MARGKLYYRGVELTAMAHVTPSDIARMIRLGTIKRVYIAGRPRISARQAERFLATGRKPGRPRKETNGKEEINGAR